MTASYQHLSELPCELVSGDNKEKDSAGVLALLSMVLQSAFSGAPRELWWGLQRQCGISKSDRNLKILTFLSNCSWNGHIPLAYRPLRDSYRHLFQSTFRTSLCFWCLSRANYVAVLMSPPGFIISLSRKTLQKRPSDLLSNSHTISEHQIRTSQLEQQGH